MEIKNESGYYLASALTGRGFLSYWPDFFMELERLYLLQGNMPAGQSLVIRLLGLALADRGMPVDYFHRAEDPMVLEGLIISSRACGVLSGVHPCAGREYFPAHLQVVTVQLPAADLPEDDRVLNYDQAEQLLQSAGIMHDSYCLGDAGLSDKGTFKKAAGFVEELQGRKSNLKHYFAGGVGVLGEVDFLSRSLTGCRKRYLLRGSPGSGAMIMREILIQALSRGWTVEGFHSWIEPAEWAALLFPEIKVAVIDTTCCYKDFSSLPGDIIWDLSGDIKTTNSQKAENKVQEIKSCLADAAGAWHAHLQEGKGNPCFTEEEIKRIIRLILKDTAD